MLEELLNSTTADPADISRAFLFYLRHEFPAGGPDAEYRFSQQLYPLLLKSLFGPLLIANEGKVYRHQPGGWLSRQMRWSVVASSQQRSPSLSMDPVVQLLSPRTIGGSSNSPSHARAVFDRATTTIVRKQQDVVTGTDGNVLSLIQQSSGNFYEYPFLALTQNSQHLLMDLLQREQHQQLFSRSSKMKIIHDVIPDIANDSNNEVILYSVLLQTKPVDQRGLVELFQLLNGPAATQVDSPPRQQQQRHFQNLAQKKMIATMIYLSAWEKFFFLFFHFPFAKPVVPIKVTQQQQQQRESYGDLVYFHLFKLYVNYYLPHIDTTISYNRVDFRHNSELFIRLIITFWINYGNNMLSTTATSRTTTAEQQLSSKTVTRLSDIYDTFPCINLGSSLSDVQQPYHPNIVLKSLQYLISHVCSDEFLEQRSFSCCEKENNFNITNITNLLRDVLSPQLLVLQLPMYDFIRTSLRYAPPAVNSQQQNITTSLFSTALDLWLTWLEPWNHSNRSTPAGKILSNISSYVHQQHPMMTMPKPTAPSKYSHPWKCYVASNAHMYCSLFAIFVRRARELDFSQRNFKRSIEIVLRVARVFSKELCMILSFSSSSSLLKQLRIEHEQDMLRQRTKSDNNVPLFPSSVNLHDCQADVRALLEEIYFQHFKKIREMNFLDRLGDSFERLAGSGGSYHERLLINKVKDQTCLIVGLPDYEYASSNQQVVGSSQQDSTRRLPQTAADGISLTEKGREEIVSGKKIFVPQNVKYIGDPMKARVRSYEIGFLVHWCVMASHWLNFKLGLGHASSQVSSTKPPSLSKLIQESENWKKKRFRFNLRFLADYRNLVFFASLVCLYKVLQCLV